MRKIKVIVMILFLLIICGCTKEENGELTTLDDISYYETNKKTDNVIIKLDDDRKILIELYPDVAPITVANFKKLVASDFYDGVIFHRVINNFMIQTGDASSLGKTASTIKGEFSDNGVDNNLSHTRGVVSMARTSASMDSASSQFFIVQADSTYLDGSYAAFGRVIAGMDVVDSIASVVTDSSDKPLKDITISEINFVKVVDKNE
jgi:peptidyl-prolyl cis-trans isomerase B (cyclophilin B)